MERRVHAKAADSNAIALVPLVVIPLLAVIDAPLFLGSVFLERRLHLSKSVIGLTYWMVAWILIGISPLAVFRLGTLVMKVAENGFSAVNAVAAIRMPPDSATLPLLAGHGTLMGIIYCILCFLRRRKPPLPV